jgi:DNA-binding transcriptional LysR family regulator
MLNPARLRVFVEVCERHSFSRAAEELTFTQPAVSRQVAALEREVGARLFERHTRAVRLTQAGETLLPHARAVLARLAAAEDDLDALRELRAGRLRLGSFSSANVSVLPEAIRRFAAAHPEVELVLSGTEPEAHLSAVEHAELDLALVTEWDIPDEPPPSVRLVHLLDDQLLLALPAGHELSRRKQIRVSDLTGARWIEGAHPDCLGPLARLGIVEHSPRIAFVCDDWNGKQGLVAAGVGLTLFPSLAISGAHPDIVLRTVEDLPHRRIYAACRADLSQPSALSPMLEILETCAHEQAGRRPARAA